VKDEVIGMWKEVRVAIFKHLTICTEVLTKTMKDLKHYGRYFNTNQ